MTADQKPTFLVVDPDHPAPDQDDPMTGTQAAILRALCDEAGEPMDGGLTRGQADDRIAALKDRLGKD